MVVVKTKINIIKKYTGKLYCDKMYKNAVLKAYICKFIKTGQTIFWAYMDRYRNSKTNPSPKPIK